MFGFERARIFAALLLSLLLPAAASAANRLADHPSPYLALHGSDPVDWQEWNADTIARAKRENKLLFVSVGYFACHWCHVMQRESYKNPQIAALLNRDFIPVKVDRELNSGLDDALQTFSAQLNGVAGWPLNAFVTPEGFPAFVVLYAPADDFRKLLTQLAGRWTAEPAGIRRLAKQAAPPPALRPASAPMTAARSARAWQQLLDGVWQESDTLHGGFGQVSKFPMAPQLHALLERQARQPDARLAEFLRLTFDQMAARGLRDHIGGGFFRYTTDPDWDTPHFEKMLYDNAGLLALYSQAHAATGEALFGTTASATAEWVLRDMQHPDGAFFTALDADSDGHEGRFYVWSREEITELLEGQERSLFSSHFGLDAAPNFEASHWHLNIAVPLEDAATQNGVEPERAAGRIALARTKLLERRNQRVWPGRDDKILTAWNALMIRGLAIAARALQRPDMAVQATRAVDFLHDTVWRDGQLFASYKDGRARFPAYLDDHAFLADALVELLQCRWRTADLDFACALLETLLQRFEDPHGGFYFTANDHESLLHRPKPYQDEAIPSGNALAARALLRLGHLLGEHRYLDAAHRLLVNAWPLVQRYPQAHCGLLGSLRDQLDPPVLIVMRGEAAALASWQRYVHAGYHPQRLAFCIPQDAGPLPGLLSDYAPRDTTVAYVCRGTHCEAPVESLEALLAALAQRPRD